MKSSLLLGTTFLAISISLPAFAQETDTPPENSAESAFSAISQGREIRQLSLQEAIQVALEKTPDIKIAAATAQGANARYEQSKDTRLPILSISGDLTQFTEANRFCPAQDPNDENNCLVEEIIVSPSTRIGATARLSVPITTQYALKQRQNAAYYDVEAAELGREVTKREIIWQTEQAYLQLLKARAVKETTQASIDLASAQVEKVRKYYEVKALAKNDLLQAELGLAQAKQADIQAEAGLLLAESTLSMTLGLNPTIKIEPTEDFSKEIPLFLTSLEEATAKTLENRLELTQLEKQISSSKEVRDATKSSRIPSLNATGTMQFSPGQAFSEQFQFFAGVSLNWNVWDWGLVQDQVEAASATVLQIEAQKEKLALGLTLDVRSRYLTLLSSQASLRVSAKSIESAKENLRITEARFGANSATTTDLLDAQVLLTRASVDEITARYDYYIALAGMRKAMGEAVVDRYVASTNR